MAGKGSRPGERRGGRKKGTPNKTGHAIGVRGFLAQHKCDPIKILADVAMGQPIKCLVRLDKENGEFVEDKIRPTLDQIIRAATELAQYVEPKRKSIEGGPEGSAPVRLIIEG